MRLIRGLLALCAASVLLSFPPSGFAREPRPGLTLEGGSRARALALYYKALSLEGDLQLRPALAAFEQLLELEPSNAAVAMRAAELAAAVNRHEYAQQLIEAAFAAEPEDADSHYQLVRFFQSYAPPEKEAEYNARALELAEAAIAKFPGDARFIEMLVKLHGVAGRRALARDAVEAAAEAEGGDAEFWLKLGELIARLWAEEGDAEVRDKKLDAVFAKALAAAPDDVDVADKVANQLITARRYAEAAKVLQALAKSQPGQLFVREKLVRVLRILGRRDQALLEARQLVEADPNRARRQRLLAEICAEAADYQDAVRHRARAVLLDGGDGDDYVELAIQLSDGFQPGRHEEAMAWLRRGAARYPDSARMVYLQAVVAAKQGDDKAALEYYGTCEKLAQKGHPELLDEGFYFAYGAAAEREGEHDLAGEQFEKAVGLVPEDRPQLAAKSLNYHGFMLLELDRDIDKAGEMIRKAVELEPESPSYLDSLGWYYYKKTLFRKALVELRRAKELMGDDVDREVLEHIALTYEALGEKEKAADYRRQIERSADL